MDRISHGGNTAPGSLTGPSPQTESIKIGYRCLKNIFDRAAFPPPPKDPRYQPTSVFLLLYNPNEPHILAIQKSDTDGYPWRNQVALPGGHVDQEDAGPLDTAFRELHEEVGIPNDQVRLIGSMGHFQTIRCKDIEVFVGMWNGQGPVRYDTNEISRVLEIPLRDLVQTHNELNGFGSLTPSADITYPFQDVVIWGVTAKILNFFISLIHPGLSTGNRF